MTRPPSTQRRITRFPVQRLLVFLLSLVATDARLQAEMPLEIASSQSNQLRVTKAGDGEWELTTLGDDPWIQLHRFPSADLPETDTVLAFEYFSPQPVDGLEVYYGPPIIGTNRLTAGSLTRAESWLPHSIDLKTLSGGKWTRDKNLLRLDFGRRPNVTLRIRNLHLRAPNTDELRSQTEREDERRDKLARQSHINAFYATSFSDRVQSITVDRQHVIVRGRVARDSGNLRLIELRPEVSLAHAAVPSETAHAGDGFDLDGQPGIHDLGPVADVGAFEKRLPRVTDAGDRTTSRWALAESISGGRWRIRSHWRYATDLSAAAAHDLPPIIPTGIKGMGGVDPRFPLDELLELGVHNITINITVTQLMDTVPHPNWVPFEYNGRQWYVNQRQLDNYDKLTQFCARHEIVASGILLVPFANSEFGTTLIHPEADRAGHYAMPNFTTPEGVAAYEAVLEFLTARYSAPNAPHGRIANWIIHNEVGYGWEWTNMGRQPAMLYMDHYLRSMRLVHNVARRHDPHARVFISLTHHWNNPNEPSWKSYSNRDLLNRLAESSRVEGDFAWGLAYHPYPQNLRSPETWNDQQVTDDFDTPMITPKNIAVLDRWMQRADMRDATGNLRGVLLSEQGFNSPDYSHESQRLQAAAYVYLWRRLRPLKTVEAFHNHRWVDHPREGGLLLGLRKLPEGDRLYGDKKIAWDVYKALDTPSEAETVRALGVLPPTVD